MRIFLIFISVFQFGLSQKILIPMDPSQKNHLKAYGVAFWTLEQEINVEWILTVSYTHLTLPTSDLV